MIRLNINTRNTFIIIKDIISFLENKKMDSLNIQDPGPDANHSWILPVSKTVQTIGKVVVERKQVQYVLGFFLIATATVLLPKPVLASTFVSLNEKKSTAETLAYLKSFGSTRAWAKYFQHRQATPEFHYYAEKISKTLKPMKPLAWTALGVGISFSYANILYKTRLNANMIECYTENRALVQRLQEVVNLFGNDLFQERPF